MAERIATPKETAETLAKKQREISVSEFFAKNRHLLGFDNPKKALLTAVKEAVDNSLDACEEAGILPEVEIWITSTGEDRFVISVRDNGPGIVKSQIPNIFGKLLYGSKFHTLRMARGQQGIGISAAGMYGLLTTGKSMKIISRVSPRKPAHYYEIQIDTRKNRPEIIEDNEVEWGYERGTVVEIELEARYQRGRQSVDDYLAQTAIANPHVTLKYVGPDGTEVQYARATEQMPPSPRLIKPHPYGVELGVLIRMLKETKQRSLLAFLRSDFSRVTPRVAAEICEQAGLSEKANPARIAREEADKLLAAISQTKIMSPPSDCVIPIGEELIKKGLAQVIEADFYEACTRPPAVYRGNPFRIECGVAYGRGGSEELATLLRFANRVPLLYQQSACSIHKAVVTTNWRSYGLSQSRGALPQGPVAIMVHIASVWVPFTSESKEAIAHYPEILKEMRLALQECGRKLAQHLRRRKREAEEHTKRTYIERYIPHISEALKEILKLKDGEVGKMNEVLKDILQKSRKF
ncbi:MAG: DNA topoisomerase VI subunit B [Candidatus Abyssobacteria bacterium SURF_17]|uniref:Type 2 DNA topoisomerase 6 subunit B n=1 Tax=Candidatus Abyssobacteria bacterium SURF_17 TaxID=2093361 RepID=A0A419EVQ1_9BACT|nr:MAG: DNA topoisomerase VI subunit B [Candidatus Abyssubacteria bacterium SURF_17]